MQKANPNVSYDFKEGQVVSLFYGVPQEAWSIYEASDDVLREALSWNDKDGDFDGLPRVALLEIFLADFVMNRSF